MFPILTVDEEAEGDDPLIYSELVASGSVESPRF